MGRCPLLIHTLKLADKFWDAVKNGPKTFEIRKDDRHFEVGDTILFKHVGGSGHWVMGPYRVTYILRSADFPDGIRDGYVVMGIMYEGSRE